MKKTILLCILLSLLCFFGCEEAKKENTDALQIVCTVFPQYDFVCSLTEGTGAKVTMLLTPGAEPHSYEPTPKDMVAAAECDLFICVGGESEAWANKIIGGASISEGRILRLTDVISPIKNEEHHHEEAHEEEHADYDEHVWTSPKNALLITKAIADRLSSLDGENAKRYVENYKKYEEELLSLDASFSSFAEDIRGKVIVFGDRFPFRYLTEAYGIEYISPYKGCEAHTEASAADIASVIDKARETGATTVFAVDMSNGKLASSIASEIGGKVGRLYSCHTLPSDAISAGEGYISTMEKNLKSLQEAFGVNG